MTVSLPSLSSSNDIVSETSTSQLNVSPPQKERGRKIGTAKDDIPKNGYGRYSVLER